MKILLNIDTAKLNEEQWTWLAKITNRALFPLKDYPKLKCNKDEEIPDFIRNRVVLENQE